jgi:hypothetical protein
VSVCSPHGALARRQASERRASRKAASLAVVAEQLGRVTGDLDAPRGPDVAHRVTVPELFLIAGATIELSLPRNLACARCDGGGCDACERSGAVSIRKRSDPSEPLRVTLPRNEARTDSLASGLVVRVPERGGLAPEFSGLPRGHLLLRVCAGTEIGPDVTIIHADTSAVETRESVWDMITELDRGPLKWPIIVAILAVPLLLWLLTR